MKLSKLTIATTSLLLATLVAMTAQADNDPDPDTDAASTGAAGSESETTGAAIDTSMDEPAPPPAVRATRATATHIPEATASTTTDGADAGPTRFHAGIGAVVGMALGDLEDYVDASPGITLGFGYDVHPRLRLFGELRYIPIIQSTPQPDEDITYYDIGAGLRGTVPLTTRVRGFVEGRIIRGTIDVTIGDQQGKQSGLGFGARAGLDIPVSRAVSVVPSAAYTTASINPVTVEWLSMELTLALSF